MIPASNDRQSIRIRRVTAFTTNYWESALSVLRLVGPAREAGVELIHGNQLDEAWPERVSDGEAVVLQRDFPRYLGACQQVIERARREGKSVFFDLDDWLLEVPERHPDRASRYYSEAVLPMVQAMYEADAITVSTPALARFVQSFNTNVLVLPNYLDDSLWSLRPPRQPQDDSPLMLRYMGGDSHLPDLSAITPVLLRVMQRYAGRVRLHVLGVQPPAELFEQPYIDWTPARSYHYAEFAADFLSRETDIFIAPLEDNDFNRCKSAIKFLEYSAAGATGVYSRLEPYEGIVRHGENGYLAGSPEEWESCLCDLIESPEKRYEMAIQAQETVRSDWLMSDHAGQWPVAWSLPPDPEARSRFLSGNPSLERLLAMVREGQEWQEAQRSRFKELSGRAHEQETRLREQAAHLEALQAQVQEQSEALIERTNRLLEANQELYKIYTSEAWKLMEVLAPQNTRRGRAVGLALRAARVLRVEGPGPFVAAASRRVRRWLGRQAELPQLPAKYSSILHPVHILRQFPPDALAAMPPRAGRYDVIVLPVMNWETRVQRPQHLALRFAHAGHRVFFGRTTFSVGEGPILRMVAGGVLEFQLPAPFPALIATDPLDERLERPFGEAFSALRAAFAIEDAVIVVDSPFWTPLALRLRQDFGWKLVYDCMDYHQGFSTNQAEVLREEDRLTEESDRVWVTAHRLMEEKSRQNPHCTRIPNGVEFEHFRFPPLHPAHELQELRRASTSPRPIIGYYGAIADWFDVDLVRRLALARPRWNFVLIGSTMYSDVSALQALKNVRLLGELSYAELPAYLHAFDVAMIPFLKTPLTDATNPVKLFEYLSAGKPVVTTDLEELRHYRDWARLASGVQEWLAALEAALADRTPERTAARIDFARGNTWDVRFGQIQNSLVGLYPPASVIVAASGTPDMLHLCLESLCGKTSYPDFEVLVVGPAAQRDALPRDLAGYGLRARWIEAPETAGLFERYNYGAAEARGEVIAFLSGTAVVTRPWLSRLTRHLQNEPATLVGAATNFGSAGCTEEVGYSTWQALDEFQRLSIDPQLGKVDRVAMLTPDCFAVYRSTLSRLGTFSTQWKADLTRFQEQGVLLCARDVFIHVWESGVSSNFQP